MTGFIMDVKFRLWLYGIGVAAGSVMAVYGILTLEQVSVWLGLLSAILGITAIANVGDRGTIVRGVDEEPTDTLQ